MSRHLLHLPFCLFLFFGAAQADPVILDTNALHHLNGDLSNLTMSTSLTSHPDIVAVQYFFPESLDGYVTFSTHVTGITVGTPFHAEFIYDGQLVDTFDTVYTLDWTNDVWLVYGGTFPFSYVAKPAMLNVTAGSAAASYTFTVREPVPEPVSLILMGTGLFSITAALRLKRTRATASRRAASGPNGSP